MINKILNFVSEKPIEIEAFEHESYDGNLTEKQYQKTIEIMQGIIDFVKKTYNVDFKIDRDHIIGHNEVAPIVRTMCPGKEFPFARIIQDLKKLL